MVSANSGRRINDVELSCDSIEDPLLLVADGDAASVPIKLRLPVFDKTSFKFVKTSAMFFGAFDDVIDLSKMFSGYHTA